MLVVHLENMLILNGLFWQPDIRKDIFSAFREGVGFLESGLYRVSKSSELRICYCKSWYKSVT